MNNITINQANASVGIIASDVFDGLYPTDFPMRYPHGEFFKGRRR